MLRFFDGRINVNGQTEHGHAIRNITAGIGPQVPIQDKMLGVPFFGDRVAHLKGFTLEVYRLKLPFLNFPTISNITNLRCVKLALMGAMHRHQVNLNLPLLIPIVTLVEDICIIGLEVLPFPASEI